MRPHRSARSSLTSERLKSRSSTIRWLLPLTRASGWGRRLIDNAFDLAARDGMRSVELIAVEGAEGFRQAMGFAALDATSEIAA